MTQNDTLEQRSTQKIQNLSASNKGLQIEIDSRNKPKLTFAWV